MNKMHSLHLDSFVSPYLRGIGQIMLQSNQWTGLIFLAGIFVESAIMGVAAIVAVITGTLTAKLLKYDSENIRNGLYGFSAALVGVAMIFNFKPVLLVWLAIIVGSVLAAILQNAFIMYKIPGFTFPFVLITWVFLYFFHHLVPLAISEKISPIVLAEPAHFVPIHGFGEVMFISNDVSGMLFFIAIFINSPITALYGMLGSLIGENLADSLRMPENEVNEGIYSFNAVLSSIANAGSKVVDGLFVLLAVVLAFFIQIGMQNLHLTILTFPFILSVWITHFMKKIVFRQSKRAIS
jgi:urea transporter